MPERAFEPPYYPIIYVRGYAGSDDEIENTVSDPYMGFNLRSTKIRQLWPGKIERHYFESPVVRLMKDFDYRDVYSFGLEMAPEEPIDPRRIVIYRYYDQLSASFGQDREATMEDFGNGLSELILKLRDRISVSEAERDRFPCMPDRPFNGRAGDPMLSAER